MKSIVWKNNVKPYVLAYLLFTVVVAGNTALHAQSCPPNGATTITSYPNTYYPGQQATVNAGSTSVVIGAAMYGSTPISNGDILLIIQMQGGQINSTNTDSYGSGVAGLGSGYLHNAYLLAGNMEYAVATNAVPLSGGTLNFSTALINSYQNTPYGTDGQYTYQVIQVPLYYNLTLGATITVPHWNGAAGGVVALIATNNLDMNGQTIDASGAGFRGGGGVQFGGGVGARTDIVALSTNNTCASKGEGIAGTPRYLNNGGSLLVSSLEGYPNGSFDRGAPGNAGGGGTDGNPSNNAENSGGGGGGNGGPGGNGGNSYGSNVAVGGLAGAAFGENRPSRLVMGGGGGAGTTNNGTGTPGSGFASSGMAGGGIVIICATTITNTGVINVNGASANTTITNDAAGGGGAGGSVLIYAGSGHSGLTVFANGGAGGSNTGGGAGPHGPGGGGGGGVIFSNNVLGVSTVNPGAPGTTTGGINYGAMSPGSAGVINPNAVIFPPIDCSVLPMQFVSVEGTNNNGRIRIDWQMTNEINVKRYIIEKSGNSVDFSIAGTVDYNPGNSGIGRYSFLDVSTGNTGTSYYRIKTQDKDGHYIFSKIIAVRTAVDADADILAISPDPAGNSCTINWFATGNTNVVIRLFDATGHTVLRRQYPVRAGMNVLPLTTLSALPNGLYLVRGHDEKSNRNGKLLILH